jgi:hypothetical protein
VIETIPNPGSPWWNVVNAIGTWAAAAGTVFTGIVALWLASRDRRIDLQLTATLGRDRITGTDQEAAVVLSVRNAGHRNVTVRSLGFTIGLFPWMPALFGPLHRGAYLVFPSREVPKFLHSLDDGGILERTVDFNPLVYNLADELPRPYFLAQWTIRFWALTTIDEVRSVRVTRNLRRRIVKAARRPRG